MVSWPVAGMMGVKRKGLECRARFGWSVGARAVIECGGRSELILLGVRKRKLSERASEGGGDCSGDLVRTHRRSFVLCFLYPPIWQSISIYE